MASAGKEGYRGYATSATQESAPTVSHSTTGSTETDNSTTTQARKEPNLDHEPFADSLKVRQDSLTQGEAVALADEPPPQLETKRHNSLSHAKKSFAKLDARDARAPIQRSESNREEEYPSAKSIETPIYSRQSKKSKETGEESKRGIHFPPREAHRDAIRLPTNRRLEPWQIQKDALKEKLSGQAWAPRKRLSPDAVEGIRALHEQYPDKYTTPYLAEQFHVSPEAIRRILKSNWRPSEEERAKRLQRWENRGKNIWGKMVELGVKPPKKWREMGVDRDSEGRSFHQRRVHNQRNKPWKSHSGTSGHGGGFSSRNSADMDDEESLSDRIL
ncbi:hypothetical protein L228DRAFT_250414 [Xylona heveae TC161]|uniref:Required for respiratory growth protein 9, mitochondrial n=1 Tax=Xylona heveae (strain CBS 132557 / TC161) TaxID=1328760 RepID=A0A165A5U6_XYLHT|nr:hypothetical protein L228DRAFT_250414 [Xylona heveae TC161]KZF19994.1 hypothetical protein L228DRAFT_250414 [Xylona heveae TC161]